MSRKPGIVNAAVLLTVFLLCLVVPGCRKSNKIKVSVEKAGEVAQKPAEKPVLTGLPAVAAPIPDATPDSPDDKLATHYGVSLEELKKLKERHSSFPAVKVPEKKKGTMLEGLPTDETSWMAKVPGFKVIAGPEITGLDNILPEQVQKAAIAARDRAFRMKIPVFTKPVVFLEPHLDDPQANMTVLVGLPVPEDIAVPKGIHAREFKGGEVHFLGRMEVQPLNVSPEARDYLNKQLPELSQGGACKASLMVILDDWPDGKNRPVGSFAITCF